MTWFSNHALQIGLILVVAIILGVGNSKLAQKTRSSRMPAVALWGAFIVTVGCGLVLGYALHGVVAWLVGLGGLFGGVIGSVGALIALAFGWHAVYLAVALIRDVADQRPDEDARKAALWIPTFLPAGWSAVLGIAEHPRGIGTGLVAAIMAGITVVYVMKIVKAALASKNHRKAWSWFLVPITLLAGLVMIPLVAYIDGFGAEYLPGPVMLIARLVLGAMGIALLIGAIADVCDHVPDAYMRTFLVAGVPLLFVYGALIVAHISSGASSGFALLGMS